MVIKDIFKGIWLVFIVFLFFLFILIDFNWLVGSEWYIYDPPCSRPRGWGPDGYQAGHAWHASGLDHAGTTIRDIQTTSGKYRNIQKAPIGPALVTWCYGESPWAQERSPWTIQYTILFVMFLYPFMSRNTICIKYDFNYFYDLYLREPFWGSRGPWGCRGPPSPGTCGQSGGHNNNQ